MRASATSPAWLPTMPIVKPSDGVVGEPKRRPCGGVPAGAARAPLARRSRASPARGASRTCARRMPSQVLAAGGARLPRVPAMLRTPADDANLPPSVKYHDDLVAPPDAADMDIASLLEKLSNVGIKIFGEQHLNLRHHPPLTAVDQPQAIHERGEPPTSGPPDTPSRATAASRTRSFPRGCRLSSSPRTMSPRKAVPRRRRTPRVESCCPRETPTRPAGFVGLRDAGRRAPAVSTRRRSNFIGWSARTRSVRFRTPIANVPPTIHLAHHASARRLAVT